MSQISRTSYVITCRLICRETYFYFKLVYLCRTYNQRVRVVKSRRMRWAGHVARMGGIEMCIGCWWGSLRERGHWGDQDVDRRIILRWIFKKLEGVVGTGWSWLRIGAVGGHLWVR